MAGLGFKDFQVGEVLTSSDVDGYLMQQTMMRFADAAARGSALGTAPGTAVALAEGMLSYLQDTDAVERYDGSGWNRIDVPQGTATAGNSQVLAYGTATGTWNPVNALRIESGTHTFTVTSGSGTEVQAISFGTAFAATPTIWENHGQLVKEVTFSSVSTSGFTINAPWTSTVTTTQFVRWYALGVPL